jgi:hypothetical protein
MTSVAGYLLALFRNKEKTVYLRSMDSVVSAVPSDWSENRSLSYSTLPGSHSQMRGSGLVGLYER